MVFIYSYIRLLKTILSEKIALPDIKATVKIIGRLMVAPAMHVDIPIRIDWPKVNNITTKAYQPGRLHIKQSPYSQRKREHLSDFLSGKTDTLWYLFP